MTVSFRVKLLASHAAVALAVSAVTLVVVEQTISRRMAVEIDRRLEGQARALAPWMKQAGHPDLLAQRLAGVVGARVTIIDASGVVTGDSLDSEEGLSTGNRDELPEVRAARAGGVGHETRFSTAVDEQVRFVAVPAPEHSVVRLGLPIGEIIDTRLALRRQLMLSAVASLLVAFALAALVAGPLTRRLRHATAIARRIGAGDYAVGPATDTRDEVGVLASTLARAATELRETDSRRREFLATVAHEIRTPITSIRGYAQTLLGPGVAAADRDEFLQTIQRNAVRVGQLVETLLELEALQAGAGPALTSESVALEPVARHVLDTLRARAEQRNAVLTLAVPTETTVRGDADAIERILLNLADNALRHGGTGVRVTIDARTQAGRVTVGVSDTGPGIPEAQRATIFERFRRGPVGSDPEQRGTGLGLAIARELAQAMGGTLVAEGEAGHGAGFTLNLPAWVP